MQDIEIAKDLVQDVMVQVYLNKEKIDIHTTFKGYLLTALRNRLFNYKRDLLAKKLGTYKEVDTEDAATAVVDHRETLKIVKEAISRLPEQCRQVFLLRREANLTNQQVAQKLGISVKTVEAHMSKAMRILRKNLSYNLLIAATATVWV